MTPLAMTEQRKRTGLVFDMIGDGMGEYNLQLSKLNHYHATRGAVAVVASGPGRETIVWL